MANTARMAQAKKAAFLVAMAKQGNVSGAARVAQVPRRTVYDWLAIDEDFRLRFAEAQEEAVDALEGEAVRRAFDGSDTLLIFLLKGAKPTKYRERIDLTMDVRSAIERLTSDPMERAAALAEVNAILAEGRR